MKTQNLVIIGSGPAAYTAAIYVARANLSPLVFEGFLSGPIGGQLMTTTEVENFPGFPEGILGAELMDNMKKQVLRFNTTCIAEDVVSVNLAKAPFLIKGTSTEVLTNALIIATGAMSKRLDIPGTKDNEFWQKGVSSCAICDGAAPIYRNNFVYVIGGGDTAVEEAIFLTKFAKKVFIVHRRDQLRASKIMAERALKHPKIEILWNREIISVLGDKFVKEVILQDTVSKKQERKEASGAFFAIGHQPNTSFLENQVKLDENGYIITDKFSSKTNIEGVFAAGDVQDHTYRQAITAAGSGCMAAIDAERYLSYKGYLN